MPLVLQKLFRRRIVLAAALALALVIAVSLLAGPLLAVSLLAGPLSGLDPNETAVAQRLNGPSTAHLLGTDELGRDLFARIAYGGRYSLTVAPLTAKWHWMPLVDDQYRVVDAVVMHFWAPPWAATACFAAWRRSATRRRPPERRTPQPRPAALPTLRRLPGFAAAAPALAGTASSSNRS